MKKKHKDEVKDDTIEVVSMLFHSMGGTPIQSGTISELSGLLGGEILSPYILNGTYTPPEGTDQHTKAMIKLLQISDPILEARPIKPMVM